MKIRSGFVSNSSSSSFICIGSSNFFIPNLASYEVGSRGNVSFGWKFKEYNSVYDRINYAWIVANYTKNGYPENMKMLEDILKEKCELYELIPSVMIIDDGYIDHQSVDRTIFESKSKLEHFLFSSDSYIRQGNDNEDAPEGWFEGK